jgi:hypothetical protein
MDLTDELDDTRAKIENFKMQEAQDNSNQDGHIHTRGEVVLSVTPTWTCWGISSRVLP